MGGGADTITFLTSSHPTLIVCCDIRFWLALALWYNQNISFVLLLPLLLVSARRSITRIRATTTMRRNPVPLLVWLCLSWLWSSHVVVTGIEAQVPPSATEDKQPEKDEQEPPLSSSLPPMDQDPIDTPQEDNAASSSTTTTCPAAELSEQALQEKCQAMWQTRELELQQAQDQQAALDRQALEQQWQTTLTQSVQAVRDELATECTQTMQRHKAEAHTACQGQLDDLQQVHQQALQQEQQEQEQSTRHEKQIADLQEQLRQAQNSLTTAQDRHSTELEACRTSQATALQHAQEETSQEWHSRLQAMQDQLDQQHQQHAQQLQQTHNEVQATVEARVQAALEAQQTHHAATTQLVEQAIQQTTLQLEQAHEGHLQTLNRRYTLTHDELQQVQGELHQLEGQHTQLINDLLQARQDLLQANEIVRLYRLGWLQRWIGHPLTRFGQTVYDRLVQPLGYEVYLVGQPVLDPLNAHVVQPYLVPAALVAWETTGQTATVVSEWLQHKVVHPTAQAVRQLYRVHVCQTMPRALEQGVIWAWPKLVQGSHTAWTTSRETLQHAHQVYTTQLYPTAVQPWWDPVLEYWDEYVQEPWTNEWKPLVLQHYAHGQSILLHQYWTPFTKWLFDHVQQHYSPEATRDSHTQYGDDDDNTARSTSPSSLLYHVTEYWATEPQESLYWIQGGLLVMVSLVTVRLLATCCCGCGGCCGLSKRSSSSNFAKRNGPKRYGSTTPPPKVRIQEPPTTTTTPPLADPSTTTTTTPRTTTHRGPQQQPHAPPPRRMTPYPKHLNKTTNNNNNNLGGPPPPPSSSTTAPPSRPLFAGATPPPPRTTTARGPPPSKKKS